MVTPEELACARETVESGFQDAVTLNTTAYTIDEESNRIPGAVTETTLSGNLQRMSPGEERTVADRLQGAEGYRVKVPYGVSPQQTGTVTINGARYEILAGFGGEARSTHTKFYLRRIS